MKTGFEAKLARRRRVGIASVFSIVVERVSIVSKIISVDVQIIISARSLFVVCARNNKLLKNMADKIGKKILFCGF